MKTFIKDAKLIEETHELDDLLDFSNIAGRFNRELGHIEKSALVGLVGAFGTGKSTMLYQLSNQKQKKTKWIFFDAWKFPERSNLWEGFVLDFVRTVDPTFFRKIREKIDGVSWNPFKALITVLSQGANFFIPGLGMAENLNKLFRSSPVRRVFELQEILEDFINNHIKNTDLIYVVIEDIDRSGDNGIYFLETLKQFIRSSSLNKKIIGIIPVSDKNFNENKESYLKPLDYIHKFEPKGIDFTGFIEAVFDEKLFTDKQPWVTHLNFLFSHLVQYTALTLRELKSILRNANIRFRSLEENEYADIDIRIFLYFSAMVQLNIKTLGPYNENREQQLIPLNDQWNIRYFVGIAQNSNFRDMKNYKLDIPIVPSGKGNPVPVFIQSFYSNDDKSKYALSSIYLEIFNVK